MKEEFIEVLDRRIKHWEDMLSRAEERRKSTSANLGTLARASAVHECSRCQTVLLELRDIREEIMNHV